MSDISLEAILEMAKSMPVYKPEVKSIPINKRGKSHRSAKSVDRKIQLTCHEKSVIMSDEIIQLFCIVEYFGIKPSDILTDDRLNRFSVDSKKLLSNRLTESSNYNPIYLARGMSCLEK